MTLNIQSNKTISFGEKLPILLTESFNGHKVDLSGRVELRGGYSSSFPKKSYEIDLDIDYSLGGLPEDDDWILNSNYIDKTFLRHVVSYELFRNMGLKNKAPRCSFVSVQLNGEYNGLYVLMEKPDRSSLSVVKNHPASVIFKEPHIFRKSYDGVSPQHPGNFHQQIYPDHELTDMSPELEEIRSMILNSSEAVFNSEIEKVFDIKNLIDWHLLILVTNNADGILKNFYLYRQHSDGLFNIAPWDYDHSFGRDGDNEFNPGEKLPDITRNILFARLMEQKWYRDKLKDRWSFLKGNDILSKDRLSKRVEDLSNMIETYAEMNFSIWPLESEWYEDDNDFREEIEIMKTYISKRFDQLNIYFLGL